LSNWGDLAAPSSPVAAKGGAVGHYEYPDPVAPAAALALAAVANASALTQEHVGWWDEFWNGDSD